MKNKAGILSLSINYDKSGTGKRRLMKGMKSSTEFVRMDERY